LLKSFSILSLTRGSDSGGRDPLSASAGPGSPGEARPNRSGQPRLASMHRLLQEVLRARLSAEATPLCLARCVWVLREQWRFCPSDPGTWPAATALVPHVEMLGCHAYKHAVLLTEMSALLSEAAVLLSLAYSSFSQAQGLLELALRMLALESETFARATETARESDSPSLKWRLQQALSLHLLGKVHRYLGHFQPAETHLERALHLWELALAGPAPSPSDAGLLRSLMTKIKAMTGTLPATASLSAEQQLAARTYIAHSLHELGVLHCKQHRLPLAEKMLGRALKAKLALTQEVTREAGGLAVEVPRRGDSRTAPVDPFNRAATLHQLAVVAMRDERRLGEADALLKEALQLETQVTAS
jgi:tetratricopeptide (TPR) repeat protein